jgi:membrane associated rhomboid family serine protease
MTPASVGFHCPACTNQGSQRVYRARDLRPGNQITLTLLGINGLLFLVQLSTGGGVVRTTTGITAEGLLFGPFVADGEYWRLLTSGFLHANLPHILFNSWALWVFGPLVEQVFSRWRMVGIYLAGLFGGSAAVMLFNWGVPTLGASAAVLGLGGALVAAMSAQGQSLRSNSLVGVLVINLLLPLLVPGISFWGHLGGIVAGFVGGYLVAFTVQRRRPERFVLGALTGLVLALIVLGVVGARVGGVA